MRAEATKAIEGARTVEPKEKSHQGHRAGALTRGMREEVRAGSKTG